MSNGTTNISSVTLFFICLMFFSSCFRSLNKENIVMSPYLDSMRNMASHLPANEGHPLKSIQYLDSVYAQYKNVNVLDKFRYYVFCCNVYQVQLSDDKKAMLYADSLVDIIEKHSAHYNFTTEPALAYYSKGDVHFCTGIL